jgi:hypothetical protein
MSVQSNDGNKNIFIKEQLKLNYEYIRAIGITL